MNKKKLLCEDCGYYWEVGTDNIKDNKCPVCEGEKIHRSQRHKRFAKKARPKVRGLLRTR